MYYCGISSRRDKKYFGGDFMKTVGIVFLLSVVITAILYLFIRKKITKDIIFHIYAIMLMFWSFFIILGFSALTWHVVRWVAVTYLK